LALAPPLARSSALHLDSLSIKDTKRICNLDLSTATAPVIRCSLQPLCAARPFNTYNDYEVHYTQAHSNRCRECCRNLPSQHLLDLHIREHHDPFTELKRERGEKTYFCFVEGCNKICSTIRTRRLHLVDLHKFPKNYNFGIIDHGIDHARTLLCVQSQKGRQASLNCQR